VKIYFKILFLFATLSLLRCDDSDSFIGKWVPTKEMLKFDTIIITKADSGYYTIILPYHSGNRRGVMKDNKIYSKSNGISIEINSVSSNRLLWKIPTGETMELKKIE
jgi:hypothetical protein